MISAECIQNIRDRADIFDVVGHFVKLNRNNAACCPFHNENTPSFSVNKRNNRWHCYGGCGEGGDAISFVMKHTNKDFQEAVTWLADFYSILIEYEQEDEASRIKREQQKDQKQLMQQAVMFAQKHYRKLYTNCSDDHSVKQYLFGKRQMDPKVCEQWLLGYAPKDGVRLASQLINAKLYNPALEVGLVTENEGKANDFFYNRIMIPIHDINGNIIGFGGRWLPTGDKKYDDNQGKYFNPKESLLYSKSKVWFGLYQAITAKAFKAIDGVRPPAVITEGYLDVISLHEAGVHNAVASCGTAVTPEQIRLLKRYTNHFIILTDGDKAGIKAAMKLVDLCLQENIRTEVIALPDGMDPDDYVKHFINQLEPADGAFAD